MAGTLRGLSIAPGAVAQPGERLLCKQKVVGSNPISSTRFHCVALQPRRTFKNRIVPLPIKAEPAPNGQVSAGNVERCGNCIRVVISTRPVQDHFGNVSGDVV